MTLTFLHITDIHHGGAPTAPLYGGFRRQFFRDLDGFQPTGPCDLLLITGDVAFSGSASQYEAFDHDVLEPLLGQIAPGAKPVVLAVPGNHDLVRVDAKDKQLSALVSWHDRKETREAFWEDLAWHRDRFAPYSEWWERARARSGGALTDYRPGKLAGEFCATVECDGVRVAVVGLNTAFLHLNDEFASDDGRKLLALTEEQMLGPFQSSVELIRWLDGHALRLLLTHHPVEWLHAGSRDFYEQEIASLFDAHLCGHAHVAAYDSRHRGGGSTASSFLGASLFGLEKTRTGAQRIHGYAWGRCDTAGENRSIEMWPRLAHIRQNNTRTIGADPSFDLHPSTQSFFAFGTRPRRTSGPPPMSADALAAQLAAAQHRARASEAQAQSTVALLRRVGLFRVEIADVRDVDALNHLFDDAHEDLLCLMQRAVPDGATDLIEVDVLGLEPTQNADEMRLVYHTAPTQLSHQQDLAEMTVRAPNGAFQAIGEPPGVGAWVLAAMSEAGSGASGPGVAIAGDIHRSPDIVYYAPLVDGTGYASREVKNVFKQKTATRPRYRCLMTAPIHNPRRIDDDPETPGIETQSEVVGVINFTSSTPHRFTEHDVTWARACATIWGQLWAAAEAAAAPLEDDR